MIKCPGLLGAKEFLGTQNFSANISTVQGQTVLIGHPKSCMEVDDPKGVGERVMRNSYYSTDKAIGVH